MKCLVHAWDRFWFSRFDPTSLGVCRLFLGCVLSCAYLANRLNWHRYYAPDGITSVTMLDPGWTHQSWWNVFRWSQGVVPVETFWWLGLVCSICLALGLGTRLVTGVLFLVQVSLLHAAPMVANGEDQVFVMLLFYGLFAPFGASLSLDNVLQRRLGKGRPEGVEEPPRIWPVRLMQLNILLVYVLSLPHKVGDDSAWLEGTALYWVMMNRTWCRYPGWLLFAHWPVSALLTYGTLLVEGLFPILVWFRRTRLPAVVALAGLHLSIILMMQNVAFFNLAMICSLWLFVPGETSRRLLVALKSLVLAPPRRRHTEHESLSPVAPAKLLEDANRT